MPNPLRDAGIEHVVVLMLENRGFDHVMGWLYDADEQPTILPGTAAGRPFVGLSTLSAEQLQALANPLPARLGGGPVPIRRGARTPRSPSYNPGEHFVHIMAQLWGRPRSEVDWDDRAQREAAIQEILLARHRAPMNGYVQDFDEEIAEEAPDATRDATTLSEILDTYTRDQLPVLSGLARHYAVSDQWFCSVPSQTNTNRAFSMVGTSRGLVTNNYYDAFRGSYNPIAQGARRALGGSHVDRLPGYPRNLFTLYADAGVSWKVYWQAAWPPFDPRNQYVRLMLPELAESRYNANFVKFDPHEADNPLFRDARQGRLPALTWIEPAWSGGPRWDTRVKRTVGNDMHPVSDTTLAEDFVQALYNALTRDENGEPNPRWRHTLLIVTFDENGGTYDHVPPPAAHPTARDTTPHGWEHGPMDPETRTQFGYRFDSLGVRVPTLFISPLVDPTTLLRPPAHVPFDHTSLIATLLEWQGIPRETWMLGDRVAHAPSFAHVVRRTQDNPRPPLDPVLGIHYSASLGVPRPVGDPIAFGGTVRLQYIGSLWDPPRAPWYLGPAAVGGLLRNTWYPRMTPNLDDALAIQILDPTNPQSRHRVPNQGLVLLRSTDVRHPGQSLLGAWRDDSALYYTDDPRPDGARWQIRLVCSREFGEPVRPGDYIVLVSQFSPVVEHGPLAPDPIQRMVPSNLNDPTSRLTTVAGQWAIWQIVG